MTSYRLEFPDEFTECAWEVEAKGWLPGVVAVIGGWRYPLTFYDPVRLSQDIEAEIANGRPFFEPNLIVVPTVTRACIESAVGGLVAAGRYGSWAPEAARRIPGISPP